MNCRRGLLMSTARAWARCQVIPALVQAASPEIHVREVLTLAVNCSTASLTAADRMDSNRSKSWCAPGSSA